MNFKHPELYLSIISFFSIICGIILIIYSVATALDIWIPNTPQAIVLILFIVMTLTRITNMTTEKRLFRLSILVLYFTIVGFFFSLSIIATISMILRVDLNNNSILILSTILIVLLYFSAILLGQRNKSISLFLEDTKVALFISNSIILILYEISSLHSTGWNVHSIFFPNFFGSLVAMSYLEYKLVAKNKHKDQNPESTE
ncbi:hypothetical protein [Brevibacillus laterosporus]|uniref:hypothetical protein n=1 Tax=Brevibacillus laterosporus TaxID=1465 RepID=UPI000E6CCEF3|nr:hypothetical protein [Brevibacillus laterosporus]AYB37561.1 hypothetical protein D5F52_04305 [Brevibacillus laterosporus]MBM7111357.1 hypothetical protein [Brevibacillus laterosporus]